VEGRFMARQSILECRKCIGCTPLIDHRVPFLIKLAGQKEASTYSAPFNTALTHDLILDVLKGKISTSSQVHSWLDAHRTIGESPYQTYEDTE